MCIGHLYRLFSNVLIDTSPTGLRLLVIEYHEPVGTPGPRQSDRRRTSEPTQVTNATLRRSEGLKIQYGTSLSDRNWARAPPAHARAYYGVEGGRGRRARSRHSGQRGSIRAGICPEYVWTRLSYSHANPAGQVSRKVDIFHTGLLAGEK